MWQVVGEKLYDFYSNQTHYNTNLELDRLAIKPIIDFAILSTSEVQFCSECVRADIEIFWLLFIFCLEYNKILVQFTVFKRSVLETPNAD